MDVEIQEISRNYFETISLFLLSLVFVFCLHMPKISVGIRLRPDNSNYPKLDQLSTSSDQTAIELFVGSTLHNFSFDRIFNDQSTQLDIYKHSAQRIVDTALEGYNGCIFAYGQTGAGKTFTMTGNLDSDSSNYGISAQAAVHLFSKMRNTFDNISLRLSIVEIYNETLLDLLVDLPSQNGINNIRSKLNIIETDGGVVIPGLHIMPIDTIDDTLTLLMEAQANRAVAEHQLNHASSRSHMIFTYYITRTCTSSSSSSSSSATASKLKSTKGGKELSTGGNIAKGEKDDETASVIDDPIVHQSKIHIVDLAGSERVNKTGSAGNVQKEANYINRSLSFLEQVVIALSQSNRDHIPYRQSKLTYLLKDSLGGNSNTYLIACIWPRKDHSWETLSTLRFAARMKNIETHPIRNRLVSKDSTSHSNNIIKQLILQNDLLKKELAMRDFLNGNESWLIELSKQQLLSTYKQGIEYLQKPSSSTSIFIPVSSLQSAAVPSSQQQGNNESSSSASFQPLSIDPIEIHSLSQSYLLFGFYKDLIYELANHDRNIIEQSMEKMIHQRYLNQSSVHYDEKTQKIGKKLLSLLQKQGFNGQYGDADNSGHTEEEDALNSNRSEVAIDQQPSPVRRPPVNKKKNSTDNHFVPPQLEEEPMTKVEEKERVVGEGNDQLDTQNNEYFQDFTQKTVIGKELFVAYEEAKETLKNNKKRQKQIITMLNDQKYIIDEINIEVTQYQTIYLEKQEQIEAAGSDDPDMVQYEEELEEIQSVITTKKEQLEKTKKQYRTVHQELLLCKDQIQETQSLKKRAMNALLMAFNEYMQQLPAEREKLHS
jgi:kinesin family protein 6/9